VKFGRFGFVRDRGKFGRVGRLNWWTVRGEPTANNPTGVLTIVIRWRKHQPISEDR
jgi:hypothetical protein